MTPHLIIILSLSASTVGFALLADWYRREAVRLLNVVELSLFIEDGWRALARESEAESDELCRRTEAALACLTPHSANIGRRMARKLRGEA